MQIIIKKYDHYNRTLGMQITSKEHYDRVCKEGNWVSDEQAKEIADKARKEKIRDYKISDESKAIIEHAKNVKDSKGNVKLSDRAIEKLIEKKAINKKIPDYMKLPSHYTKNGGFCP